MAHGRPDRKWKGADMAAMSVGQMVELFVEPGAPIYVKAFDGSTYGSEDAPVTLVIRNSRAIYYLVNAPGELGLARAYLQGDIDSPQLDPGDPYALFGKLVDVKPYLRTPNPAQLAKALASVASHGIRRPEPPAIEGPGRMRRMSEGLLPHTRKGDAATVSYHYDQSNDFYALFLGPSMTYTCAVFDSPDTSLEAAQKAKLDLVLDKLALKPGDRLLDIGCGWGSMAIEAAKRGIHTLGVTLSEEQVEWAQRWIRQEGLEDLAEVRLMDYRDVPEGDFDGICSLGMMEHVGYKHYPAYFQEIYNKLKPGAMLLNHQITRCNSHQGKKAGEFIDRYIFPTASCRARPKSR